MAPPPPRKTNILESGIFAVARTWPAGRSSAHRILKHAARGAWLENSPPHLHSLGQVTRSGWSEAGRGATAAQFERQSSLRRNGLGRIWLVLWLIRRWTSVDRRAEGRRRLSDRMTLSFLPDMAVSLAYEKAMRERNPPAQRYGARNRQCMSRLETADAEAGSAIHANRVAALFKRSRGRPQPNRLSTAHT